MNINHYKLGYVLQGKRVIVTLRNAANVQLLDDLNFGYYKAGMRYRLIGGYYKISPLHLSIPHSGNWHVVIDGHVSSDVRIE